MPRTASKTVEEGEMTPFHKDAFVTAVGTDVDAPAGKGSAT